MRVVLAGGTGSLGRRLVRTDPALALTGRRCVPRRLVAAGFEFKHPMFAAANADLIDGGPGASTDATTQNAV